MSNLDKIIETDRPDLLLLHMPFGINFVPSLALSLLNESVKRKGFSSIVKYYSLRFTKLIGETKYLQISTGRPMYHYLFGEWLFSKTLFENLPPDWKYIKEVLNSDFSRNLKHNPGMEKYTQEIVAWIPEIKYKAEIFINTCLQDVLSINPKIVGFSSSFQQNVASLSLAKRIKENMPETVIVFGGANCEGEMGVEIIKQFPFVDIVVSGEADETLPELVSKILKKENYTEINGVVCKDNLHLYDTGMVAPSMITNMDELPIPNFDEYFEELKNNNLTKINVFRVLRGSEFKDYTPVVLFESSRGCWWGEKSHCTFCGLNGNSMLHRSKSALRALDEIKFLKKKYQINGLFVTDNILDMSYFKDFVPALAESNLDLRLFYEIKSNLNKQQLTLLKEANIVDLQPGIESLNTHVLDLMKKGVKSIQNVQLLKWCKEFGIKPIWNLIWGFPGETNEDYDKTTELVAKISHLAPPNSISKLRLDRFSPNFNFPEKFGLKKIYPYHSYNYIYPFEEKILFNLCYFFDYHYDVAENFEITLDETRNKIYKWINNFAKVDLFFIDKNDALVIYDLRGLKKEFFFILQNKERFLYLFCDKIQPLSKIKKEYAIHFNQEENENEVIEYLDSFIDKNLMIRENNSYLSLAIPVGNYSPNKEVINTVAKLLKASS